jgi:hypothetical protein
MEKMLNQFKNKSTKWVCLLSMILFFSSVEAQTITDTLESTGNVVFKDKRLDLFGKKMKEYNEGLSQRTQLVNGFRLLLMKTTDREAVMKLRARLLQDYPEHKNYVVFVAPSLKLKFGNFASRADAEKMRKQLMDQNLVSGNIYILGEQVEIKPADKNQLSKDDR